MRQKTPFQYVSDDLTGLDAVNAGLGGPVDVLFWNGSGSAWVAGSWYEADLGVATYGLPRAAKISPVPGAATGGILTLGVALEATPNLAWGKIRVFGKYSGANVTTSVAAGAAITLLNAAVAGRAITMPAQAGSGQAVYPCGVCLTLAASNTADVWISSPFFRF